MSIITGEENIGDIAALYPEVSHILMKYGLHCIGCHIAFWETLEEGAKGHGMDDEMFKKMITEINEILNKQDKDDKQNKNNKDEKNIINISSFAIMRVKEMMKQNKIKGVLKIKVITDSQNNNTYEFHVEKKEKDVIFEKEGLKISVDKKSLEKLKGSSIEYIENTQGSGFKVNNPNSKKQNYGDSNDKI